jgi:hypothetical protein
MTAFGVGILTKNRPELVVDLIAKVQALTETEHDLVVSVDHDDVTVAALEAVPGITVVTPLCAGIPANRNRLLAELADHDVNALIEDDHYPVVSGWEKPYLAALGTGVTQVIYRMSPAHGPIVFRNGPVVYRNLLGCPVVLMTREAYRQVGAWDQQHFGSTYGLDDGQWAVRARRRGMLGKVRGVRGPWWPCLDDDGASWVDVHDPPSSDGKSAEQRAVEVGANGKYLEHFLRGYGPTWMPNPEETPDDVHP